MKYLIVGDLHTTKDNIESTASLFNYIKVLEANHSVDAVCFMGDQYHEHSNVKTEVMNFYDHHFRGFLSKPIALVGNHDMAHDGKTHAMIAHKEYVKIIDEPTMVGDILMVPFFRKNEDFIRSIQENPSKVVFCHQSFDGSKYETGMYVPDGVSLSVVPDVDLFVCGHIHGHQSVLDLQGESKVIYIGTPRHLTKTDAGQVKHLALFDSASRKFDYIEVPEAICPRFRTISITQNTDIKDLSINPATDYVDVSGTEDFVKKVIKKLPAGTKTRTIIDREKAVVTIKESDGIPVAFRKYFDGYCDKNGIDNMKDRVLKLILDKCGALR